MPLLPSALPPKGEASRYGVNNFLNLIAFPDGEGKEGAASPHLLEERLTQAISESSRAACALFPAGEGRGIHFSFTNFHLSMI